MLADLPVAEPGARRPRAASAGGSPEHRGQVASRDFDLGTPICREGNPGRRRAHQKAFEFRAHRRGGRRYLPLPEELRGAPELPQADPAHHLPRKGGAFQDLWGRARRAARPCR